MNIHVNTDPFPFLIIEDLYTEDELTLIWQELDYYQSNSYILNANTNPSLSEDGKERTKNKRETSKRKRTIRRKKFK